MGISGEKLEPIIKWAGGKERELPYLMPYLPVKFERYMEPFVGGGALAFAVDAGQIAINDLSKELALLYRLVQRGDRDFFQWLRQIDGTWKRLELLVDDNIEYLTTIYIDFTSEINSTEKTRDLLVEFVINHTPGLNGLLESDFNIGVDNFLGEVVRNLTSKMSRMKKIEKEKGKLGRGDLQDNIECAFKSALYMHFRYLYNEAPKYELTEAFHTAIFYFIRNYCYSSMFRYNKQGKFNVPYGGISYNRKYLGNKIDYLESERLNKHLQKVEVHCSDFEDFLSTKCPGKGDFIFFDPPYDTDFSTYSKNCFSQKDHLRLAHVFQKSKGKCMLVIKNTDFIYKLYGSKGFRIKSFDKAYQVSFQNRNNRNTEHLIITNYW